MCNHVSVSDFPEFSGTSYVLIELNAGEMLYIPKLWWHHVVTMEPRFITSLQHLPSVITHYLSATPLNA